LEHNFITENIEVRQKIILMTLNMLEFSEIPKILILITKIWKVT